MAFMLEAGFIGIMVFGWDRVNKGVHLFATCMVAAGSSLSAFWIMVANSWMQTPAGGHIEAGRFTVDHYLHAIFNPAALPSIAHMWVACLETSLFVIAGISAWYILRNRNADFYLKSFKLAIAAAIVIAPLQIWLGDSSGRVVFQHQPAKGAAIEGHWETNPPGKAADWALLAWPNSHEQANDWEISIPYLLSILATHTLDGKVVGLRDIPVKDQPPALVLLFYAFRLMVAIGFWFLLLTLWTLLVWWKRQLTLTTLQARTWLLRAWAVSIPLGFIAVESGWIVREVGRQPWVIYGILRTADAGSELPAAGIATTLVAYLIFYLALLLIFLVFARKILRMGPASRIEQQNQVSLSAERRSSHD
jgi:cytochrome d ubiquinol oxidase subunit I